ncbi:MAG TPA: endonuclease/exonuclease/phosphatase family protein [Mycobacteriales bacterium]|nr:endonuclease/exonuclease/phosphatase family protein [Mycobacteriales bacterium]
MLRLLTALGLAGLVAVLAVRLTGSERGALLVLLVGALPLTLLAVYPLLAAALWLRSRVLVPVGVVLVVAHGLVVAPDLRAEPLPGGADAAPSLRVVVANLYRLNPRPEQAAEVLRGLDADVLVVPELDARGRAALDAAGLADDLPHTAVAGDGEETVGLLSRLPLEDVVLRHVGARVLPQATVGVGGVRVRLLAVHPLPPLAGLEPLWRVTLADTARQVDAEGLPVVVAGDLNADRHHAVFRGLLDTGLRDAHGERGRGLARTWPGRFPVLHLDHVLVRDGDGASLAVLDVREVRLPGSDHRTVVADLAVLAAGDQAD